MRESTKWIRLDWEWRESSGSQRVTCGDPSRACSTSGSSMDCPASDACLDSAPTRSSAPSRSNTTTRPPVKCAVEFLRLTSPRAITPWTKPCRHSGSRPTETERDHHAVSGRVIAWFDRLLGSREVGLITGERRREARCEPGRSHERPNADQSTERPAWLISDASLPFQPPAASSGT